jgi:hypothetical protein
MDQVLAVLRQYGPWGVVLFLGAYMLIRGELTFRFPRRRK